MPPKPLIEDLAIRYGFNVLGAVLILVAGFIVARWVASLADARMRKGAMEPPMRILLVRVVRVLVLAVAFVAALDKFGVQIAPLIAGIGVAGIGVGFALQGVLSNIVAGLTIIVTKPFRVGEYIEVAGVHGEVFHVDLPSTVLLHADKSRVIVPNRKIVGEILHNYGVIRQLKVFVSIADAADLTKALAAASDVIARNGRVLKDHTPVLGVASVDDAGIRINVGPWAKGADAADVEAELYRTLIEEFQARDIGIGVRRREIRVVNGGGGTAIAR
jgi:small conductance mechanosensitive channel